MALGWILLAFSLIPALPAGAEPPPAMAQATDTPEQPAEAQGPKPEQKPIKIPLTEVIGTGPNALEHIPGSGRVVTKEDLEQNRRFTINEALREVPGVNVRDEEGFGLRPNIGVRGLNPTRSTKIHIMEDGVPIMLMPYGDPGAYYFPPLFRFDRIEVLKGSGQLLYGPQNIGGVMNMITRMPPATPEGHFQATGGSLSYVNTHFDYGGMWGKSGYFADFTHYQGTSPRFYNQRANGVNDLTFKTVQELTAKTSLLAKFNYYREDSTVGYQGITEQQWGADPHHNAFNNDKMDFRRIGYHVAVNHEFSPNLTSTTNFFGHYISRDWARQMQDQDGNPATGNCTVSATGSVGGGCVTGNNINATAPLALPQEGRFSNNREYWVYGVEPRFHLDHNLFGIKSEADFGARYMYEESQRQQILNSLSGIGLSCPSFSADQMACLGEDTQRTTNAYALFFQNRFLLSDKLTITPGFRLEHVDYDQLDRRNPQVGGLLQGTGTFAKTSITEALPGVGITYAPIKQYTLFAGVHRGFGPPQISDAIQIQSSGTQQVNDLDPELSWNYEVGLRGQPAHWLGFETTWFRMDFQNQIVSQSVAGGSGATLTNGGRTTQMGIEVAWKADMLDLAKGRQDRNEDVLFDVNYTWLWQADFRGTRNSAIQGSALLPGESSVYNTSGNRLPYAPKSMLTAGLGYANRKFGFDTRVETQCISDMFSDDRDTHNPTPNGQRGIIRGWCVLNAAANQYVKPLDTTFFITGKNMLDQLFIADRTRGIYPGLPFLVQAGAKWTF